MCWYLYTKRSERHHILQTTHHMHSHLAVGNASVVCWLIDRQQCVGATHHHWSSAHHLRSSPIIIISSITTKKTSNLCFWWFSGIGCCVLLIKWMDGGWMVVQNELAITKVHMLLYIWRSASSVRGLILAYWRSWSDRCRIERDGYDGADARASLHLFSVSIYQVRATDACVLMRGCWLCVHVYWNLLCELAPWANDMIDKWRAQGVVV